MNESEPNRDRRRTDGGAAQGRVENDPTRTEGEPERVREARSNAATNAREAMESAGPTDDVPEDAIASVEDFAHQRDERGELLPVTEQVPGTEKYVRVRPITQGEANRYLPDDGNVSALSDEQMFEIIQEFVVEPDFSGVESLDDFGAFSLDPLLMAVMRASGFDMAQGMITENSDLMDAIEGNSSRGN